MSVAVGSRFGRENLQEKTYLIDWKKVKSQAVATVEFFFDSECTLPLPPPPSGLLESSAWSDFFQFTYKLQ